MLSCIIQNNTNNSHSNQSSSLRAKQNACFSLVDEIRNASSKLVLADDSCTRVSARNERDDLLPTRQGRSRNTFNGAVRRGGGGERRKRAAVVFSRKVRASGKEDDQSWSQLSRRSATVIESTPSHASPTPVFIHPTTDGRSLSNGGKSKQGRKQRERERVEIYIFCSWRTCSFWREEVNDLSTNDHRLKVICRWPFRFTILCSFPFPFPRFPSSCETLVHHFIYRNLSREGKWLFSSSSFSRICLEWAYINVKARISFFFFEFSVRMRRKIKRVSLVIHYFNFSYLSFLLYIVSRSKQRKNRSWYCYFPSDGCLKSSKIHNPRIKDWNFNDPRWKKFPLSPKTRRILLETRDLRRPFVPLLLPKIL